MEKQKIDMSGAADLCKWEEVHAGDYTIHVRDHIPLNQKLMMAQEWIEFITSIDEENHLIVRSELECLGRIYFVIEYYTDIDVTDVNPTEVIDWALNSGIYDQVAAKVNYDDLYYVEEIVEAMFVNARDAYAAKNSLTEAIHKSFGFLFDGKDITEALAETQAVSEQMLGVVDQLNKAAKKSDGGKIKAGGNVINIAKKK